MSEDQVAGAAGAAVGAGVLAFLATGPTVSPEVYLLASAFGGIAGGVLSTMNEPGPINLRALFTIAGYGAALGASIVTTLLWLSGLPPTIQALGVMSSAGGILAWPIRKHLPKLLTLDMLRGLLAKFIGVPK